MTNKVVHTPGPWVCDPDLDNDLKYIVSNEFGNVLTIDPEKHDANAQLISAAPDLLSSLEEAVQALSLVDEETAKGLYVDFWGMLNTAKSSISKARGEIQ